VNEAVAVCFSIRNELVLNLGIKIAEGAEFVSHEAVVLSFIDAEFRNTTLLRLDFGL